MGELLIEGEIVEVSIDSIKPPRNVFRHLDGNKVKQLAENINLFGLRHPITISKDGFLISGLHRLSAMKTLGKKTIRAEILPVTGVMARILTLAENLLRSDLTQLERGEHLNEYNKLLIELGQRATPASGMKIKKQKHPVKNSSPDDLDEEPPKTTKKVADEAGISARKLQNLVQIANKIDQKVRDKIRNTDISDNESELLRLARVETTEDQNTVVDMVVKGECKTIREAIRKMVMDAQRKDFAGRAAEVKKLPDNIKLICHDFFEAEGDDGFLKHNSIDAIFTDPPYIDSWREWWAPFLGIAADILKPGGFLISYVGHVRLPDLFEALRETQIEDPGKISKNNRLEFFWICALDHSGLIKAVHPRSVQCGFKPIIILYKPPMRQPYKYFNDLIRGSGREKSAHPWQQSAIELIPLIDAFTAPGSTVLDPFMGSGTTGIACKMTARKFIGFDISQENVEIATTRISETYPMDI